MFFLNSILLGVGLAMDAFSVSIANGLKEPNMKKGKMRLIAGVFGGFQTLMPLAGWFCVHTILYYFQMFQKFIPWIALALLSYIGGEMLLEGIRKEKDELDTETAAVGMSALLIQGVATSIDALSVGFTISDYGWDMAIVSALIIGAVTYVICVGGLKAGKKFGTALSDKACILGGVILIAIGLEIFIKGLLG